MVKFNSIFLLFFSVVCNAQLSGHIIMDGDPSNSGIVLKTTTLQTGETTDGDLEGYFSIQVPAKLKKYDVLIEAATMNLKINNLTPKIKLNLGDIELPELKTISLPEFDELEEMEKIKYVPVYHWANLLVYLDKTTLSKNYLLFYCNGVKHQTTQFTFDPEARLISIDVKELINCD